MGVIYLAEDRDHNNARCVVKQLISKPTNPEEQAEAVRLFQREARILSGLDHPGIVRVFDNHTTSEGKYFLVMDYVPGSNLDAVVQRYGPFDSEAVIEIAIQCCEVLEYLHELNPPIIYRDLKPSNLMLTPDGRIIFIDFGIARSFLPKEAATRVVTAGYSPPEQYFSRRLKSAVISMPSGPRSGHLLTGLRPKPLAPSAPKLMDATVLKSLDVLIRQLTAHEVENGTVSAKNVRHQLYRIYKELHPEFEIPK